MWRRKGGSAPEGEPVPDPDPGPRPAPGFEDAWSGPVPGAPAWGTAAPGGGNAPADVTAPGGPSNPPPTTGSAVRTPATGVPTQDHDVREVLRIVPFRRLWLALAGSSFGDWLGLLATAAFAQQLAGNSYASANFAVAGIFAIRLAPALLLGPIAGAVADRLHRKSTMVLGDLIRAALFVSIPLVGTMSWLFAATVLIECVALFWTPAKDATLPNLVPRRRLEAANQISLVATYGTAPLAALAFSGLALLNGVLHNVFGSPRPEGLQIALYTDAATFLISALVILRLDIPRLPPTPKEERRSLLGSIVQGWRFVAGARVIRGLVVGMLGAFAAAGFVVGLSVNFVRDLGAGQPGFGALFGSVLFGLATGMWAGPRLLREFSRRRLFGLALSVAGVFLVLMAAIPNVVMASVFSALLGAAGGIAWVTGYTLLGLEVEDAVRGRTFAFVHAGARLVLILVLGVSSVLAGVIGRHTIHFTSRVVATYNGAAWVFLGAGVLVFALGVLSYRIMDDRSGASLIADLASAWRAQRGPVPVAPARGDSGVFIVFEGGDGTGKSTQARMLAEWLSRDQGHSVVLTREPGSTSLGLLLRDALLGRAGDLDARAEALLFAADRAQHVRSVVRPALTAGDIVISDRFADSSIAYQGAGGVLAGDDIAWLSRWASQDLTPDLTVLLDLPVDWARRRRLRDPRRGGREDRVESLPLSFHDEVRARFLALARREPHRYLVLDASLTPEELQAEIRRRVRLLLPLSTVRKVELEARLGDEHIRRSRRADAEVEVLRIDDQVRARTEEESRIRIESRERMRQEAERLVQAEAEAAAEAQGQGQGRAVDVADGAPPLFDGEGPGQG